MTVTLPEPSWQARAMSWYLRRTFKRRDIASTNVVEARKRMEARTADMRWFAPDVAVTPVEVDGVRGDWLEPRDAVPGRTLMYMHGGAYMMCSPTTHRAMVARIATAARARAFVLQYRLAPEHPYPAALDDARAAWRWLRAQGVRAEETAFGGDSAGGGLMMALLLASRDAGEPLPRCAVGIAPWTDLTNTVPSRAANDARDVMLQRAAIGPVAGLYIGAGDPRDPYLSPLYGRLEGLPPLLLHVSDSEMLLDDSVLLAEKARAAGVRVELEVRHGLSHVWHFTAPIVPEATRAIAEIGVFLERELRVR